MLLLLLAFKLRYPHSVHLLRGNHESRRTANIYGFRHECVVKYDQEVFEAFSELFCQLPIAAIVDGQYFVVHGGLSPQLTSPQELLQLPKFDREIPLSGLMCDLMWSDPCDLPISAFAENVKRNCSVLFGRNATEQFLANGKLLTVIRAHECVDKGFEAFCWGAAFPKVITVFSAQNYCAKRNAGAFLTLAVG